MINPMIQNLNKSKILQAVQVFKTMRNPQTMIQNMPEYKQAIDFIKQNGGDPEKAFYALADQLGINPSDVLNNL